MENDLPLHSSETAFISKVIYRSSPVGILAHPLAVASSMRYNNGVVETPVTLSTNAHFLGVDGKPYFMYNKYVKQCNERKFLHVSPLPLDRD